MIETIASQLVDPFRIGLIVFLVHTARRTRREMGLVKPLALGLVFVAAIVAMSTGAGMVEAAGGMAPFIAAGLVTNLVLLGVVLLGWTVWDRVRQ